MKKRISPEGRAAMAAGGKKASRADKSRAGREGFKAMIRKAAREILAEAQTTIKPTP